MDIIKAEILNFNEKLIVYTMWNNEYPVNLAFDTIADMDNYLNTLSGLTYYLLKDERMQIQGWAMTFNARVETWFAITISKNNQGQGKGTSLLSKLKSDNELLNGWVIDHDKDRKRNGEIYQSPLQFYEKNGFKVFPEYRLELPILSAVKISWSKSDR